MDFNPFFVLKNMIHMEIRKTIGQHGFVLPFARLIYLVSLSLLLPAPEFYIKCGRTNIVDTEVVSS
jgi:hypothetical protein